MIWFLLVLQGFKCDKITFDKKPCIVNVNHELRNNNELEIQYKPKFLMHRNFHKECSHKTVTIALNGPCYDPKCSETRNILNFYKPVVFRLKPCLSYFFIVGPVAILFDGKEGTKHKKNESSTFNSHERPPAIEVNQVSESSAEIKWRDELEQCGGKYGIGVTDLKENYFFKSEVDKKTFTVGNLESCQKYLIHVYRIEKNWNPLGKPKWNWLYEIKLLMEVPIDQLKVENVSAKLNERSKTIQVTWTPPQKLNLCVGWYNITLRSSDIIIYRTWTKDNFETIPGVDPDNSYSIEVFVVSTWSEFGPIVSKKVQDGEDRCSTFQFFFFFLNS